MMSSSSSLLSSAVEAAPCNNSHGAPRLPSIISSQQHHPSRVRRRQQRRRAVTLIAMATLLLLSSSSSLYLLAGVTAAIPPSLQLNDNAHHHHNSNNNKIKTTTNGRQRRQQQQQSSNIRGDSSNSVNQGSSAAGAAAAVEGGMLLPLLGSTTNMNINSNSSSGRRRTVLVVQPDSLQRNTVQDNDLPSVSKVHPWPIPEDAIPQQQKQQQLLLPQVSSDTFRFNNNDDNVNDNVSYFSLQQQQQYLQLQQQQKQQQGLHVANYMPSSLPQGQGAFANDASTTMTLEEKNPSSHKQQLLPSPLEDFDMISGKQVILRPRLSNTNSYESELQMKMLLPPPPMGIHAEEALLSSSSSLNNVGVETQPIVYYYYDPQTLIQTPPSSNGNAVNVDLDMTPELTLPEIVYTSSGTPLTLEQVHAGGKNEVFLEIKKPKEAASWASGSNGAEKSGKRMSNPSWKTVQNKLHLNANTNARSNNGGGASWHSQDQLIVLFTVATMAIMVGALSAQRLRNQHILESCMHPDLNDDDDDDDNNTLDDFHVIGSVTRSSNSRGGIRYDKKYDLDTGGGSRSVVSGFSAITGSGGVGKLKSSDFGALLGGGSGGGTGGYYGTNGMNSGSGGRLHWRGGDMEKFDV